ncbi:MAG: glycosyltransferase family 2 protein [Candidatus Edwardsbacteria bacterium]|nr:glycosyltransferase family 2 protein [Candidatus Edwardsbacteria bacterium]
MPDLSVVIVTWNSARYISQCLDAVLPQAAGAELFVIDNHSTDQTPEILAQYGTRVRVILNRSNRGFASAANQGMAVARGQYLLLLNPDAVLRPGALDSMTAFMDAHPETGALGPQLLNPDSSIQPSCREFPGPIHCLYEFTGLSALFPRHRRFGSWRMGYFDHASLREVDQPMGACLMISRAALGKVGRLDQQNFPMFFNDVDWCYRARQAGFKIYFYPEARALHYKGVSIKKARLAMTVASHQSLARFLLKHHAKSITTYPAIVLIALALPVRLVFQSFTIAARIVLGHEQD